MKKIQPITEYDTSEYPAVSEPPSRREFLGRTLSSALAIGAASLAGGAAALLTGEPDAEAGRRRPSRQQQIWFRLLRRHTFSGGRFYVDRLLLQTRSHRLAAFLQDRDERAGIDRVIRAVLTGATSHDLTDRKRLARLNRRVGQAIARRYRARRRRPVAAPIVTLDVRRRHRRPLPGGIRRPRRPHP